MSVTVTRQNLRTPALQPLPLGQILPGGWLRDQLRIQADGLTGHLDEFWPDIAQSGWIGGDAESWERAPYWLDGLIPLAWLLEDDELKAKASGWINYILAHQHEDGWFGTILDKTVGDPARVRPGRSAYNSHAYDPWPRFILLKVLIQYFEVAQDERIPTAIERFLHKIDQLLDVQWLRAWARFRWADLVLTIHWLYDRTDDAWLLDLAERVKAQGFNWTAHFARFPFRDKLSKPECDLTSHGPNNAMAIKAPGIWFRQSNDPRDRAMVDEAIAALDRYHGQATGMFSCDEHLAGRSPSQGTELCAVVEYMYSLEVLISILGDIALADRLELIAFNALPATISPDMWTHQYDQQVNQVVCRSDEHRVYTSNGPDANLFGLEPNFGCCTANMHQGWPKFAAHLWMRTDDGLAAVAYAPCRVTTDVDGRQVSVDVVTNYPFDDRIHLTVRGERGSEFVLNLRIPAWADAATVQVGAETPTLVASGSVHRIECVGSEPAAISLHLASRFRTERRYHDSVAIYRGPLLYALQIGEDWRKVKDRRVVDDWELYATTPWNYALAIDPEHPDDALELDRSTVGQHPFAPDSTPVSVHAWGKRVPDWGLENNAAAPVPRSPVHSDEPLKELTLVPYGCTNLRVAEFPVLAEHDASSNEPTGSPAF